MTNRFIGRVLLALIALAMWGTAANAQYFGRNKVQYEQFDWRILKTDHFDLYFYPAESLKVHDAGRQSERWYTRLSDIFRHQFDRKSIVWYADHPDFQQTNVIRDMLSEGTGGVTEGLRTRVVMPFTGVYADDEHVTGHELVHVFQYNIAETAPGPGGLARLGALPLWLIEGMAEYLSLGRNDALTAMWMRDAVIQERFPTIKQLTTDSRFFPYRYGQALWAYIGGRWGDRAVVDVYRAALRVGWDQALVRTLGLSSDSLSKDWAAANRAFYAGQIAGRTHPDSMQTRTVIPLRERSEYNLGPSQSPDGRHVAFFTTRTNLFGIDLVLADAATGRVVRKLAGPQSDAHFDAISFINSSGDFSPDGSRFAFVVYKTGDNHITILNTANGDVIRTFQPGDIGAVYNVAWHPNGRQLAITGSKGGISDLYLVDVETGAVQQLTNDKYADLQPSFSPDGRSIIFATDRHPETNFERLTFGDLQLAQLDLATGAVTVLQAFPRGKHINPQYSPDGRNVYFISDQDGVSDVYRMELATGQIFRLTRLATGVSGISRLSPALSVARQTGTVMYTVFKNQGHEIVALDPGLVSGEPVDPSAPRLASAAVLPPGDVVGTMTVATYLRDPVTGLISGADFQVIPYRSSFALDAIGQPSIGVASGPFGTGLSGGIAALWGDQLGDQMIYSVAQLNGSVKDFGGGIQYVNLKRRWNWAAGLSHVPYYTYAQGADGGSASCPTFCLYQLLQRIYVDQASLSTQYPFSQTRRFELGLSGTRLGFDVQLDSLVFDPSGIPVFQGRSSQAGQPPLYYAQGSAALVGDNSFSAFTSPISGMRYRYEAAPTMGSVVFTTGLLDHRRYLFMRPFTLAFRGLHYGRYGKDADNYEQLSPLFLGEETLIRGYRWMELDECVAEPAGGNSCPTIERLLGSRLGVFNAEFRIPVLGTSSFGLVNFPYLPLEVAPFFDAGIAWTSDQSPDFTLSRRATDPNPQCAAPLNPRSNRPCAQRIPVFSTGVTFRVNLLGYMVLEAYVAKPFQRHTKNWVMGMQMAPGW